MRKHPWVRIPPLPPTTFNVIFQYLKLKPNRLIAPLIAPKQASFMISSQLASFALAGSFANHAVNSGIAHYQNPAGLTPYEYICKIWTSEPDRFILNPIHQMPGLNT